MDKENVFPLVASACKNKPLTARSHYRCQRDGKLLIAMQEDINKGWTWRRLVRTLNSQIINSNYKPKLIKLQIR